MQPLAVGALGCMAAFVLGSFGGNLISEVVVLLYFFAFLALASSLTNARPEPPVEAGRAPVLAGGQQ